MLDGSETLSYELSTYDALPARPVCGAFPAKRLPQAVAQTPFTYYADMALSREMF